MCCMIVIGRVAFGVTITWIGWSKGLLMSGSGLLGLYQTRQLGAPKLSPCSFGWSGMLVMNLYLRIFCSKTQVMVLIMKFYDRVIMVPSCNKSFEFPKLF